MIVAKFAQHILNELSLQIEAQTKAMRKGLPHEEYLKCVGTIRGLEATREFVNDAANQAEETDD